MMHETIRAVFKISSLAFLILSSFVAAPHADSQENNQIAEPVSLSAETPVRRDDMNLLATGCREFSSPDSLTIPSSVVEIVADAFNGYSTLKTVCVERGVRIISSRAFADCPNLSDVYLFDSVEQISDDAFPQNVTLHGTSGSYAEQWAERRGVAFRSHAPDDFEQAIRSNTSDKPGAFIFRKTSTGAEIVQTTGRDGFSGNFVIPDSLCGLPVTKVGDELFAAWPLLTAVSLPSGLKTIGNNAFDGCRTLTTVTLPDSVDSIGTGAFSRCYALKEIALPPELRSIADETFQGCVNLISITLPDKLESIGVRAFYDCASLPELTFPSTLAEIRDAAFGHCYALTSLELPDRLTTLGSRSFASNICLLVKPESDAACQAINGGYKYATGTFAPTNAGVKSIFWRHSDSGVEINGLSLTDDFKGNLTLPETIAGLPVVGIGDMAFVENTSLKKATLPKGVKRIGKSAFSGCTELAAIQLPQSLRAIEKEAFANCPLLETPTFPENLEWIGPKAFADCAQISALRLRNNLRLIGEEAFWGCDNISEVALPASLNIIGPRAFAYCDRLKTLTLPAAVAFIGEEAFPEGLRLRVASNSPAEKWAKEKNVPFERY